MSFLHQQSPQNVGQIDRILSIVGGASLSLMALRRAPRVLLLAVMGGFLLYRGIGGSCPLYQALGFSSANKPQAGLVPKEEQVDATIEESFPASDPPGWHTGSSFTQVSE